jgi:hypothetical protein
VKLIFFALGGWSLVAGSLVQSYGGTGIEAVILRTPPE